MNKRKILNEYTDHARTIELAQVCIRALEAMRGATAASCIRALQSEQKRALKKLDKAAELLGAPYQVIARELEPMGRTTSGAIGMP